MKKKLDPGQRMINRLGLAPELLPAVPRTTLDGVSQVRVENHGGIKSYTGEEIEIRVKDGLMRIRGDGLRLAAMTRSEMVIRGFVVSVEFC